MSAEPWLDPLYKAGDKILYEGQPVTVKKVYFQKAPFENEMTKVYIEGPGGAGKFIYKDDFSNERLWEILKKKCKFMDIPTPKTEDFFNKERTEEAGRYWERGLAHQLNDLPDFEQVLYELKDLLNKTLI